MTNPPPLTRPPSCSFVKWVLLVFCFALTAFAVYDSQKVPARRFDADSRPSSLSCEAPNHTSSGLTVFLSVGDSHGRQMVEALMARDAPSLMSGVNFRKHKRWILPTSNQTSVASVFLGRAASVEAAEKLRFREDARVHLLLSRGSWDVMYFRTPLDTFYSEVTQLLHSLSPTKSLQYVVKSVTWRVLHRFAAHKEAHFRECTAPETVHAYSRLGVCAVAAFNRDLQPSKTLTPPVLVLDGADAIRRRARSMPDEQHLSPENSLLLTEAWMDRVMTRSCSGASTPSSQVWTSSDATAIANRFNCSEVWAAVASRTLDQLFHLPPRYGCACTDPIAGLNDVCVLSHRKGHRKPAIAASVMPSLWVEYVCYLRKAIHSDQPHLLGTVTNLSSALLGPLTSATSDAWMSEVMLELCLLPDYALRTVANVGYRVPKGQRFDSPPSITNRSALGRCREPHSPFANSTWCAAQASRHQTLSDDLTFLWDAYVRSAMPGYVALPPASRGVVTSCVTEVKEARWGAFRQANQAEFVAAVTRAMCHSDWLPGVLADGKPSRTTADRDEQRRQVIAARLTEDKLPESQHAVLLVMIQVFRQRILDGRLAKGR